MNHILVVSGDGPFLHGLETEFEKLVDQYRLVTADNGPLGLEILERDRIDFVATTMMPPQMGDADFLSALRRISPSVPVVVMTSNEATCMGNTFLKMNVLKVLLEPVAASRLIECINEILFLKKRQGRLRGISIVNFLQLIELEKKTYLLEVRNPAGGTGLFYFHKGVLFDALCDDLTGEKAALKMIAWDNVEIQFRAPPTKRVQKRIQKSLMVLLMDGLAPRGDPNGTERLEVETGQTGVSEEAGPAPAPASGEPEEPQALPSVGQYLQQLNDLRGVKAVFLLDGEGRTIERVGSWPGADMEEIAGSVRLAQGGADRMIRELRLTGLQSMALESDGAVIVCLPAGEDLLIIMAHDSRTLGIIRQKAMKLSFEIGRLRK